MEKTVPDERIIAMQVGRELDALVHEKAMKRKAVYVAEEPFVLQRDPSSPLGLRTNFGGAVFTSEREWLVNDYYDPDADVRVPEYSKDMVAASQVLEAIKESFSVHVFWDARKIWTCWIEKDASLRYSATGNTIPEAVCKAALLACLQEEDEQCPVGPGE